MKLSAKELLARIMQARPRSLRAMNRLSYVGADDVYLVEGLIEGLASRNDDQVMWAVIALGHLRPFSAKAGEALTGMVHHPAPFVRESVMSAMKYGQHTDAEVEMIVNVLQNDRMFSVRAAAARTLGGIPRRPSCVKALLDALRDADESVRGYAAVALKMLRPHPPEVVKRIKAVMARHKTSESVRSQLEAACGRTRIASLRRP